MLPSHPCMQAMTCRIRIEQTKESACKFDQFLFGPEINKATCIRKILVLYGVLTKYVFHQVRPPDQGVYSWTTMKIEELLSLKGTGWGPPTHSTRSRTIKQVVVAFVSLDRIR
ncbi:hypothetical protein VPH35_044482 [Triticum aestivum]